MMNQQQPDKFFREKLENFQRPAPVAAWDRIETDLKKNNTKVAGWWWKVAASFLLVATAAYIVWPAKTSDQNLSVIQQQEVVTEEPKKDIAKNNPVAETESLPPAKEGVKKTVVTKKKKAPGKNSANTRPRLENTSAHTLASATEQDSIPALIADAPEAASVASTREASSIKKIKLQFSAEETNKYLDENAVAQATSEEKKSSTLKRILKKANDLKTNQDPFGDLREKKNEILALNFKNEKRGQN